jgi:pentatricopeptide repeat domain-containing protein 1
MACAQSGDWQSAVFMLEAALENKMHIVWKAADWVVYACTDANEIDLAVRLADKVHSQHGVCLRVKTMNVLINACGGRGDAETAVRLMEAMPRHNIEPSTITYNSVMSACNRFGDFHRSYRLFQGMLDNMVEVA